ncbi:hypothetical protein AVEN_151881-1 [Araneus ventricosus]|uniref:Uncharacterized protein n=1 Tax=Araneus ventricosus TaxID=182803 RepID=A0A4Y2W5V8_ARAVE|nr:hypothetical protein AVEN_151881-1 [Araneus ventricosus]
MTRLESGYWQVEIQPEKIRRQPSPPGQGLWQFRIRLTGIPFTTLLLTRSADHGSDRMHSSRYAFLVRTLRLPCDILRTTSDTPSSPNEYLNNLEARLESMQPFYAGER